MSWCLTCERPIWSQSEHVCPPIWHVWSPGALETEADAIEVRAHDAEEAAEKWAQLYDEDEPVIAGRGHCYIVGARGPGGGVEWMAVEGEFVPTYHAGHPSLAGMKSSLSYEARCQRWREAGRIYGLMHEVFA